MVMLPSVQNSHMEELICVENRQDDILKLDDELIELSDGSLLVMEDSSSEDQMNSSNYQEFEEIIVDKFQGETSQNRKEVELSFSKLLEVDEPMAVWFKWRGKWHAGIKCERADWPLSIVKAKPANDEQNKYFVIYSPETRNYSWVDMLLIQSIDEFPQPIPYETHQEGLKMVQDLAIAREFIMQKLAVEMLYIVDQIHLNALIEDARNVTVWKQFATEASHCRRYSDLGRMLQRLQNNIMQHYIKADWKLNSSECWAKRCQSANTAQIVELLQEELFDSILWNDVHALREAPAQQKLGDEGKTWSDDVMKWFSTLPSYSGSNNTQQHASSSDGLHQVGLQVGSKRPKLKVRRAYTHSRHECIVEVPMETELPSQLISPVSEIAVDHVDSEIMFNNETVSRHADELDIQTFVEPRTKDNIEDRQCQAYIEAKGRQCVRTAIGNDIYCCAHFSRKKEKRVKVLTPTCGGTTTAGTKCKHHSLPNFAFCKKHLCNGDTNRISNLNLRTLKRKAEESCSGSKSQVCNDLVLVNREIPLEIDPMSTIDDDDSFSAKNILGEILMLSGNDHNEIETANKCRICFQEFSNDRTLGDHWMENHKKEAQWLFRGYACAICFDSFSNKKLLESHVQKRHNVPFVEQCLLFLCIPCGSHFGNMDEFWLHVKSVHPAEFKLSKALEQLNLPISDDSPKMIEQGNEDSLDNDNSENPGDSRKLSCRFCGLKFDLLPDLGRHHQAAHMERNLSRRRLAKKRVRYYTQRLKSGRLGQHERGETSMQQSHLKETTCTAELEEPHCLEAASILSSDIHETQSRPNYLDILSLACTASCKVNIEASLKENDESQPIINSNHLRLGSSQKALVLCDDISFGIESTPIICFVDQQILNSLFEQEQHIRIPRPWESFTYVTKSMIGCSPSLAYEGLQLKCHCSSSTCCRETCDHVYLFDNDYDTAKDIYGESMCGKFPYDNNGRIILEEGYLVYECNDNCKCDKTCPNRILQNGIRVKLEVFKTEKKGWGVRAGEAISRGTFVCEYIGEVLDEQEAHNRRDRYGKENCNYFYNVDARVNDTSRLVERHARYVIDSTRYGNVSRFINNSCSPNLVNYQVLVESMDCKRSHIGFYASRDIALGEELTYNYHYELVDGEGSPCLCGSSKCRGRLY